MLVRVETQKDYSNVQNITREAFWNLYQPGADEHYYLSKLRTDSQFVPQLSLVLEYEGQVIAHIAYSKNKIIQHQKEFQILTFGPVSVLPSHMLKGIGTHLIRQSFQKAKQLGFKAIVILGYPDYYRRFGFMCSKVFGISDEKGKFPKSQQALELEEGYLADKSGYITWDYEIIPKEVQEFDKRFESKEKFVTRSQIVFAKMIEKSAQDQDPEDIRYSYDRERLY